jgi:tetratricopeptide (TPR) repeat protein
MSPISPSVIRAFADRQALLWVCQRYDLKDGQEVHDYELPAPAASIRYRKELTAQDLQIAGLYWEAVWFEGAQSPLMDAFRGSASSPQGTRAPIVLASSSDVAARVPPEEFVPLRILPGVIDANCPLDSQYGTSRGRVRERTAWELSAQLQLFRGRVLIVVGAQQQSDLNRLFQILEDIPAAELTALIIWPSDTVPEIPSLPNSTIELWQGTEADFVSALSAAGAPLSTQIPKWNLRVGSRVVSLGPKDVRHVLKRFELLTEAKILPPRELSMEDLHLFLRGDLNGWQAYGAGLPVPRSYRTAENRSFMEEIEYLLGRLSRGEDETLAVTVQLPAEGGAGATTLTRAAAYRMAVAGFPTLVLRPEQVDIELDHILAFSDALTDRLASERVDHQPPLLIVCDVEHSHIAALKQIPQLLASRGRKVLLLQATNYDSMVSLEKRTRRFVRLSPLKAESNESEVQACQQAFSQLSSRWNLPLQPKSTEDWQQYEVASRWRRMGADDHQLSLFWVALRFFLVEGSTDDQKESLEREIGAWIDKRTEAIKDPSMKRLLDFTAVLSSFRVGAPVWTVLRPITGGSFSSTIVDSLRAIQEVVVWGPLIEELADATLRFVHPALAEHYLNRRGIRDTVSKLAVLQPVMNSLSAGHPADVWLAESIVMEVIVPSYVGRRQFDWEWRLNAFKEIPPLIRDQSKAILHHWARCLYQSADDPGIDSGLKRERTELAIEKLQAAIKLPRRSARDEHPSHLYNTLGTAYARYARFLEQMGDLEESARAWGGARSSFQSAINLGGGINVEALLAFSLRLIDHAEQNAARDRTEAASDIAYALDLIDEAEALLEDIASPDPEFEEELIQYRARALNWLHSGAGIEYIRDLQSSRHSDLGFYCEARLELGNKRSGASISRALELLDAAKARRIILQPRSLRLYLSLLRQHPKHRFSFSEQKTTLQELESSTGYHVRPIEAFQHAVLCYQLGLFVEGAERFRKLREQTSRLGNAPPRVREVWRDPQRPDKPRLTQLKVTRVLGEWRGEAFVFDLGQRIPVRPRHFSPALKLNDVAECVIRFEFFGPLAVPPRLEEATNRHWQSES